MPCKITIHKPTHIIRDHDDVPIARIQLRGDLAYINRLNEKGEVIDKTWCVGSCAMGLTNYGLGMSKIGMRRIRHMSERTRGAAGYVYGREFADSIGSVLPVHK